ncbi:GH1 family beta-glucosidase [Gordonia alkaliphila]|uniref:GH1 family beta-glucosidase n=1 Tax=Gordonia alkaliphila TaxID=1053547 RepID=UPI001FF6724E|nr:GH1 family beta-glucosidase [Gordonia alkaliphila]MCK0439767.1 GH1 family beta-glucosidase [Gordonia alkaliphila]
MSHAEPLPLDELRRLRFSAATAAFQIEGARSADGRGASIWDDFVEEPGRVSDGSVAEPGPDSYHRWAEDVALAAGLGLDRYRFSLSWVRVQPDGRGAAQPAGLDYYSRLVDDLLAAGVTPFPTLYHWDLPVGLEADGGWLNRDTAARFADYAALVADRLGDRVKHWYTLNEPAMTTLQGYATGALAPGKFLLFDALPTVHHQLLAHGLAAPVLRAAGAEAVGVANNHTFVLTAGDSAADRVAADAYDILHNRIFADPLLLGAYPDLSAFGGYEMPVHDGDLELISAQQDFYAINFYNPTTIGAAAPDSPIPFDMLPTPGVPVTGFGEEWPIMPSALTDLLVDFTRRYGAALPPLIVSENGASFPEPDTAGRVTDTERIAYLDGHLRAVAAAMAAGADVHEYTVWSLLDNFEWADGYTQRFGLTHVDFATGTRTPKASYDWYAGVIAAAAEARA